MAALVLLGAYFLDELVHYKIVKCSRLVNDTREWKDEWWIVVIGTLAAILAACSCVYFARV